MSLFIDPLSRSRTPASANLFRRFFPLPALMSLILLAFAGVDSSTAQVAATYRFDLHLDSASLFKSKFLHGQYHVPQSFAFDNQNGCLYVVQVEATDSAGTFDVHSANGDLELTRLSLDGTAILGFMYLRGFGHGVAIGVEPVAGSTIPYLWTEVDSAPNVNGEGRGTKLGRFRYASGATLSTSSSAIQKFSPVLGVQSCTCTVDMRNGYLAMRYQASTNQWRLALYLLSTIKAGGTVPLCDVAQPVGMGTFQGYASLGSYYYVITGNAYGTDNPVPGNTELFCIDWNSGNIVEQRHSNAFGDLIYREPEGISAQWIGNDFRLGFGFGSSVSASDGRRQLSIAYKDTLIP